MKQKILIIHHGQGLGGGLVALLGLIDELQEKYNVRVLCLFPGNHANYILERGVNVLYPKTKFYRRFYELFVHSEASYFDIISTIRRMRSFLLFLLSSFYFSKRELSFLIEKGELVYLNSMFIADFSFAAKALGATVICHVREPLARGTLGIRRNIIRWLISSNCDRVISVSKDNSKRLGLEGKTTVVYDPVVIDRPRNPSLSFSSEYVYFIYLGGGARIKGFDTLVESLPFLEENVKILFLGSEDGYADSGLKVIIRTLVDPYFRKRKKLLEKLRNSPRVVRVGLSDDVFSYYMASRAVICPFSKPHAALPILEAFSVRLPVIVSDIEGMSELVSISNGIFFEAGDGFSLSAAINQVLKMTEVNYKLMADNAAKTYNDIRSNGMSVAEIVASISI